VVCVCVFLFSSCFCGCTLLLLVFCIHREPFSAGNISGSWFCPLKSEAWAVSKVRNRKMKKMAVALGVGLLLVEVAYRRLLLLIELVE
jgi:hypothetical protein